MRGIAGNKMNQRICGLEDKGDSARGNGRNGAMEVEAQGLRTREREREMESRAFNTGISTTTSDFTYLSQRYISLYSSSQLNNVYLTVSLPFLQ